jgi:hypothetical protein
MNKVHAESNNLVLLAMVRENYRAVALVAVDDKQPVDASRGRLRMAVEVLGPRQRDVVIGPAGRRDSNNSVARYTSEPGGDRNLACKDNARWAGTWVVHSRTPWLLLFARFL